MEFIEPDSIKETADGEKTSAMTDDFYLIVEKILAEYEQLRPNLVVQGTTWSLPDFIQDFADRNGSRPRSVTMSGQIRG